MNKVLYIFFFTFLLTNIALAQSFTNINANLEGLGFSKGVWGDYDNDGDLDIVLTGEPGSTIPATIIYRNDAGTFVDIQSNIPGFTYGSVEWGDYDNDLDLDLLIAGKDNLGISSTKIFSNDNGIFTDIQAALPAISEGNATWGDFDNDSDLDILLAGELRSKILRNEGNDSFIDICAQFPLVQSAFCSWADYNNDGWLDALIGGDLGGTYVANLYRNNHGSFEEDSAGFIGLSAGCAKWGDLDNDGRKDLILGGMDPNLLGNFLIYKNNGDGKFEMIDNYTFNLLFPYADLGDYDNDGYLDVILIGRIQGCGGSAMTVLYHNDGDFVLSDVSTGIPGIRQGSASWGDYNNDGHADLLITGIDSYDYQKTEIYINDSGSGNFTSNTPPAIPGNLEAIVTDNHVQLRWRSSSDDQTPAGGLSYNLFIGTTPEAADVMNPSSDLQTGYRKIANLGNTNKDTAWNIQDLDAGNYYWSVQAVDNGFLGSGFAAPQSFAVNPVGVTDNTISAFEFYPNPFKNTVFLRNIDPSLKGSLIVKDIHGRTVYYVYEIPSSFDLSGLPEGVYLISIQTPDWVCTKKLIKKK
jgi:hypothetical protein